MRKKFIASILVIIMTVSCWSSTGFAFDNGNESTVNLASGKTSIKVTPIDDMCYQLGWASNTTNSSTDVSIFTDGKTGNLNNWNDPSWFRMCRLSGREIVLDLGEIDTINSISMGYAQRNDVGIRGPIYVKYYISNDGSDYRFLGKTLPDVPLYIQSDLATMSGKSNADRKIYKIDKLSDGKEMNIQGRYVKIVVPVDVFCFADEIEIMGKQGIKDGAAIAPALNDPDEALIVNKYPHQGRTESANLNDQFLFYTGPYTKDPELTNWTKEKVSKVLGYKNNEGNITDWLFNEILVMPVGGFAATLKTKESWTTFMDYMFADQNPSTQLKAMDEAASEINEKLHTEKKISIDVCVPFNKDFEAQSAFGDINGDGISESMNPADFASYVSDPSSAEGKEVMFKMALENRKAAVHWFIDEVERRFKAAGYKNLELNSYYCYSEFINPIIGEDLLIKDMSSYLKNKGYYFTWIPYVSTNSPYLWKDLGVTTASMQPNHFFYAYKKSIIDYNADLAKKTGMSVEIEYGYGMTNPNLARRLAEYFNGGIRKGYMKHTYHTYYLNTTSLIEAADSSDPVFRAVYDKIYAFKNGEYKRSFVLDFNKPNLTDKTNITIPVSVINADNFVKGKFTLLFDPSKVQYKGFSAGAALDGKSEISVKLKDPGVLDIKFNINDFKDAISGDVLGKAVNKYSDLIKFNFCKLDGIDDSTITNQLFVIGAEGKMEDINDETFKNWSASGNVNWNTDMNGKK